MATATTITDAMAETAIAATAAQAKPRDSDPFRKGDLVVYLRMVLAPLIRSDLNRSADIAST